MITVDLEPVPQDMIRREMTGQALTTLTFHHTQLMVEKLRFQIPERTRIQMMME